MRCDRILCFVAVAACGGSPTPPPAPLGNQGSAAPVVDVELPALYARLFVAGEKTFAGELVTSHMEQSGRVTQKTPGEVTCTISDVTTIRGGKIAELACSGLELVDQISGTYVGTAQGLWKVDSSFENDIAKLDPDDALFGTFPAPANRQHKDDESRIDSGRAVIVEANAGGWCVMVTSWGGDESGWQLCLEDGVGIVGGHGFFSGGQSRDAYFGEVRRL